MKSIFTSLLCSMICAAQTEGLWAQSIQSSTYDGGSVTIEFDGTSLKLINNNSALRRSWFVFNEPTCPVQVGQAGVNVKASWNNLNYEFDYVQSGTAKVKEKIQAIETRCILFDVFGEHLRTLSSIVVSDVELTDSYQLTDTKWSTCTNDASLFLSAVTFVAEVRTSDNKIWRCNEKAIADELVRMQLKATDMDLNSKREKVKFRPQ